MFYSLIAALKATRAFPAVGERTSEGDAVQRCEDTGARTLEAEIGALIREAGDSLRGAPTESPQAAEATWISGRASEFESLPPDQIGITVPTASGWDHRSGTGSGDDDLRFRLILTTGVLLAVLGFAWMGGLGSNRSFSPSPSNKPLTSSSAPHLGSEHEIAVGGAHVDDIGVGRMDGDGIQPSCCKQIGAMADASWANRAPAGDRKRVRQGQRLRARSEAPGADVLLARLLRGPPCLLVEGSALG